MSIRHDRPDSVPKKRRRRGPVFRLRSHFVLTILASIALGFCAAQSPAQRARPKIRETGHYDIRISGAYTGSGKAVVDRRGVTIEADVKNDKGRAAKLRSQKLRRDPERFSHFVGTGTLDGMVVVIDGRVDAADQRKGEVLKSGRILFTFEVTATGRHGRGVGEKRSGGGSRAEGGSGGGGNNPTSAPAE